MPKKRVFIIHRWDGQPEDDWYPWLQQELVKHGFEVQIPAMPETSRPNISAWVSHLAQIVGKVDENTFFVGHSIGCQTILRYLASLSAGQKAGGAVFVAGWLQLQNLETEEEREIARPWLETPIDFSRIRQHCQQFLAVFSDNDPFVSLKNQKLFEQKLGAQILLEHDKGHFTADDSVKQFPIVLKRILHFPQ